jgi:hypothetical protein
MSTAGILSVLDGWLVKGRWACPRAASNGKKGRGHNAGVSLCWRMLSGLDGHK